ncbi:hypothetical protein J2T11_003845 [Paenarthrobacter nicotinovorans]|uniref:hypothetical protein n=1 Tax=Paenarthrobacter nicotinovorans TaxID=29320 RepID=UPI00277D6083|nr:hypothetical protein [Paenarthrobacter nicotinovorans]MDP9937473.1 hypothetical protein [Paenarthrobacter nicotinovorans]
MNASNPAFEFSLASSGITGTGTFCAFPCASAGLYTPGTEEVAEAAGTETLTVGDAVVEPVSEGEPLGVAEPWQPLRSTAAPTVSTTAGPRKDNKAANVTRDIRLPKAVPAVCRPV